MLPRGRTRPYESQRQLDTRLCDFRILVFFFLGAGLATEEALGRFCDLSVLWEAYVDSLETCQVSIRVGDVEDPLASTRWRSRSRTLNQQWDAGQSHRGALRVLPRGVRALLPIAHGLDHFLRHATPRRAQAQIRTKPRFFSSLLFERGKVSRVTTLWCLSPPTFDSSARLCTSPSLSLSALLCARARGFYKTKKKKLPSFVSLRATRARMRRGEGSSRSALWFEN